MSDAFRSEHEVAAEHVREILRENESLRRDVAAMRAAGAQAARPRRAGVFVAGVATGLLVGAALIGSMMLTSRCHATQADMVAPAPPPSLPSSPNAPPLPEPTPVAPPPPADDSRGRAEEIANAMRRQAGLTACWNAALQRDARHPAERVQLEVSVDADGRASRVAVHGGADPEFARCIETRARTVSVAPGAPVVVQVSFNFTAGG